MTGEYVDFYPGESLPEAVDVYGKGELLDQAVRSSKSKIWHRVRFGLTPPDNFILYAYLTRCGRRIDAWNPNSFYYVGSEAVPKNERCRACRWKDSTR